MGALTMITFGDPHILHDQQIVHQPSRKVLALAMYLAITGQAHTRAHLIALFWPDADQIRGQQNLRQALLRLRQSIESDADAHVVASGDVLRLDLGAEGSTDAATLQAATSPQTPHMQRWAALHD